MTNQELVPTSEKIIPKICLYKAYRWLMEIKESHSGTPIVHSKFIEYAKIKYIFAENKDDSSKMESFIETRIRLMRQEQDEMGSLEYIHHRFLQKRPYAISFLCFDDQGSVIDHVNYICSLEQAEIAADYSSSDPMKIITKFKIKTALNKEEAVVKADHEFIVAVQEETDAPS